MVAVSVFVRVLLAVLDALGVNDGEVDGVEDGLERMHAQAKG